MKASLSCIISVCLFAVLFFSSCGGSSSGGGNVEIADLPFESAQTAKAYSDIVLKSIRTNREKPLQGQFKEGTAVNLVKLNRIVGMYSTAIGGRDDWDYFDFHDLSGSTDQSQGFDYAWLDQKGRLGLQIFVLTKHDGTNYYIDKLDFQSRLDVIESVSFPAGDNIDDYKKIDYNWEKK